MTARTIAWVAHGDPRGYTRLHRVVVPDGDARSIHALYADGAITRTACGTPLPRSVIDLAEDAATLRCNRCFRPTHPTV